MLIDQSLAERFWGDRDPLGTRMYRPTDPEDLNRTDENTEFYRVVGIVREVELRDLSGAGGPTDPVVRARRERLPCAPRDAHESDGRVERFVISRESRRHERSGADELSHGWQRIEITARIL